MNGLLVADDGVTLGQVGTEVDLVGHLGHLDVVSGVGIERLRRVVAQDAELDLATSTAV